MVYPALALICLLLMPSLAEARNQRSAPAAPQAHSFRDCPMCPDMVEVPAGEFLMGSPATEIGRGKDEGPQHRVVIAQPFAVGKYSVTFAEWDACTAQGGCSYKPNDEGWGRGKRPVINVSWQDAAQYTAWLAKKTGKAYRLLSEAEWEYAARGVTKISEPYAPFHTGLTINYKQANYDANFTYGPGKMGVFRQKTLDVGSFQPNSFGLYDMHGNVWEWCADWYDGMYYGKSKRFTDDMGPDSGTARVIRGGSFVNNPPFLRCSFRGRAKPWFRNGDLGFRLARTYC
jgi:formylglycine-generating enzyme required for sulfatase activity